MNRIAVILYGPPGSGKGTQAELIANSKKLIHFDTGNQIRQVIYDPANANDEVVKKQKVFYEKGILCEPWWVHKIVTEALTNLSKVGGVVLSGSPRTVYEAFDEGDRRGTFSFLAELYGKENIFIFSLKVSGEAAAFRNSKRKVCPICKRGYLFQNGSDLNACPICQSPLQIRTDDDPKIMKDRLAEFETRTKPIFAGLKNIGLTLHEINGEQPPYKVFEDIVRWLPK